MPPALSSSKTFGSDTLAALVLPESILGALAKAAWRRPCTGRTRGLLPILAPEARGVEVRALLGLWIPPRRMGADTHASADAARKATATRAPSTALLPVAIKPPADNDRS